MQLVIHLYNDHLIPTPLVSYRKLSNISGHIWIKITCPDSEMYLSVSAQQEVMILKKTGDNFINDTKTFLFSIYISGLDGNIFYNTTLFVQSM